MLGDKAGSMTLQETSKPIDSGRYGLPAMETSTVGAVSYTHLTLPTTPYV